MLAVHSVRSPSSKFSSLKMCHNIAKSSLYELSTILLSLAHANVIDTHARVVVSKFYDSTKKPKKKIGTYFSRVSLGENLGNFVYFMMWMPSSQYHFLRKFYPRISLFLSKIGKLRILKNLLDKIFFFSDETFVCDRFYKTAEFKDFLPKLTLEREANRWKIAKIRIIF